MSTIAEVLKANENYVTEKEKLNKLCDEVRIINDNVNLREVKKDLNYTRTKELYKLILSRNSNNKTINELKEIMACKKLKEYPQINDVHYYPIVNNIEFMSKEEKIELDRTIKAAYRYLRGSRDISKMDLRIIKFLTENSIIEKFYIFRCNCGSDECYDKVITQEYFDKLKSYWKKEVDGKTTDEEDNNMNYGCFSTGCWNDGDVEISSLYDFNQYLKRVEYKVVKEPDTTLDKI